MTPERFARTIGVSIGRRCSIRTRSFGSEPYLITIGDHVQITDGVKFFTHGGAWIFRDQYPNIDVFGKIKIGNNVYIGNNALILPGVTIGDNVIIGAGSIVTKSFESNVAIAGNPAKVIGNVETVLSNMLNYNMDLKNLSYSEKREFLLKADETKFIKK